MTDERRNKVLLAPSLYYWHQLIDQPTAPRAILRIGTESEPMRMVRLPIVRTLPIRRFSLSLFCSVRGRIIIGFGLLVLLLVAGAVGSVWLTRQHHSQLAEMEDHTITTSLLQEAKLSGSLSLTALQHFLLTGDETAVPQIQSYLATSDESLTMVRAMEEARGNEEELAILNELAVGTAFLAETSAQVIALRRSGDVQGAITVMEAALPRLEQVGLEIDRATEFERQEVSALRSRADTAGNLAFWFAVIAGGGGGTLALAMSVLIAHSILKPLRSLQSAALAVTDGNLGVRAPVQGPQELADLGASLNQMTDSLLNASKRQELERELRESERRHRMVIETAYDAFISTDAAGFITDWNNAAEAIFGWPREEAVGRNLADTVIPPQLREAHERGLKHFLATGEGPVLNKRIEITVRHSDGRQFPVELAVWVVGSGESCTFNAFVHDVSERKRAEEEIRLLQTMTLAMSEATGLHSALGVAVREVCNTADWILGEAWIPSPDGAYLECSPAWYSRVESTEPFRKASEGHTFPPGVGLPGRAWASKRAAWMPNVGLDVNFLRSPMARDAGLKAAAAFPVLAGDDVVAVLAFYMCEAREQDERLVKLVSAVVTQLGSTIRRKQAEEDLERLNEELEKESQKVEALNRSLEVRVQERTEELRLAAEELRQRNRELLDARDRAATDSLTGISNHRTFQERIRDEISKAEHNGASVGLIMLDIDGFKAVNDSQGHLAGDEILRRLASTITALVDQEQSYRYGGDEFAVLLPLANRTDTARMAERLRQAVERQNDGVGNAITISLGVASFPEAAGSAEELIYGADAAMYWAKSAGKNRVGDWADLVKRNGDGRVLSELRAPMPRR